MIQRTLAYPEIINNKRWYVSDECYDRERFTLCIAPGTETCAEILTRVGKPEPHNITALTSITPHAVTKFDGTTKLQLMYLSPNLLNVVRLEPLPNFKLTARKVTEIAFDRNRSVFKDWRKDTKVLLK